MDTEPIKRLLAADTYTRSVVVYKDCLAKTGTTSYPAAFVCNTHSSDKPRQHWICMFFTNDGRRDYFGSYGLRPRHVEFVDFLKSTCVDWTVNERALQSPLCNVCGQDCVVYLRLRCRGVLTMTFVNKNNVWVRFSEERLSYSVCDFIEDSRKCTRIR